MKYTIEKNYKEIKIEKFEKILNTFLKKYDNELERYIDIASIITNLSIDEIESLDLEELKDIIKDYNSIDVFAWNEDEVIQDFMVDGEKYGRKNTKTFSVKETILFQKLFADKKDGFLIEMVSILFHPIVDGEVKLDYSKESIDSRKEKFKDLNMDIVAPYINKLVSFLQNKNVK
jgi:hypothetical protein